MTPLCMSWCACLVDKKYTRFVEVYLFEKNMADDLAGKSITFRSKNDYDPNFLSDKRVGICLNFFAIF